MITMAICLAVVVHDGDTIRCNGEKVRIANIDAPELAGSARCNGRHAGGRNPPWCDYPLGLRSRDALIRYLAGGQVRIWRSGTDRYGRTLARVTVNGRDAGAYLVSQGLARWWK